MGGTNYKNVSSEKRSTLPSTGGSTSRTVTGTEHEAMRFVASETLKETMVVPTTKKAGFEALAIVEPTPQLSEELKGTTETAAPQ